MAMRDTQSLARRQAMRSTTAGSIFIHPLAVVEEGAEINQGSKIWRFAHVRQGAVLGENCIVGNYAYIDIDVKIGNGVKVQNNAMIYAGVTIEDEVFIGPSVTFTNDLFPRAGNTDWQIVPTQVCYGASIGANSTVVCGHTIGEYAMVAAGSVVTKDVAPFTLVRGNPARPVGYVCVCGYKLGDMNLDITKPITCSNCARILDITTQRIVLPKR